MIRMPQMVDATTLSGFHLERQTFGKRRFSKHGMRWPSRGFAYGCFSSRTEEGEALSSWLCTVTGGADDFGAIRFGGTLRPSQVASSTIIKEKLDAGERRLLVVAPPGSGKTVLGLYVWTDWCGSLLWSSVRTRPFSPSGWPAPRSCSNSTAGNRNEHDRQGTGHPDVADLSVGHDAAAP